MDGAGGNVAVVLQLADDMLALQLVVVVTEEGEIGSPHDIVVERRVKEKIREEIK